MTKTIDNCKNCKYSADSHFCSANNCGKCKMYDSEGTCICVKINWGEECKYYEPKRK